MKKRLRKKLCVGEFQVLGFDFYAEYADMDGSALGAFVDKMVDKLDEMAMYSGGSFENGKIDLYVVCGSAQEDNAAKKEAFVKFMSECPELKNIKAGDLTDANY